MMKNSTTYFCGGRLLWHGKITAAGEEREVKLDLSEANWGSADLTSFADQVAAAIKEIIATQDGMNDLHKDLGPGLHLE